MKINHDNNNIVNDINLLQGNFIVATPLLTDPLFEKSIIFISEFQDKEAYGFLVDYELQDSSLLTDIKKLTERTMFEDLDVFLGGPMDPNHAFLIHSPEVQINNSLKVSKEVRITNLSDAIEQFNTRPEECKIVAGYCDWKMGQLSKEIKIGYWLINDFTKKLLFEREREKWKQCISSFDINLKKYSLQNGYA